MTNNNELSVIERVAVMGDLAALSPAERWEYYKMLCEATGLNPVTRPFGYIRLDDGKIELYAKRMATDQLRAVHGVDITDVSVEYQDDWIIATAKARDKTGRQDIDVGAVSKRDMRGNFGNCLMKAITKAKRRVTLSLCGLGILDETEVETVPNSHIIPDEQAETLQIAGEPASDTADHPAGDLWILDDDARQKFIAWAIGKVGLDSEEEVAYALGVSKLTEYDGTKREARDAVLAYQRQQTAVDEDEDGDISED